MIRRNRGEIVFECNDCGAEMETGEKSFPDALAAMKDAGWRSVKDEDEEGGFAHQCDDCRD